MPFSPKGKKNSAQRLPPACPAAAQTPELFRIGLSGRIRRASTFEALQVIRFGRRVAVNASLRAHQKPQRGFRTQPRVARHELPWVTVPKFTNPEGVAQYPLFQLGSLCFAFELG